MKVFATAFLISLFLGTGIALAGGGEFTQQQAPQTKIVVNIPEPETNWEIPVGVAVVTAVGAIGVALVRRRRKED